MTLSASDVVDLCGLDGCERPLHCRGMCNTHYAAWRRETPKPERPPLPSRAKTDRPKCSVPECPRQSASKGMCNAHYSRWRRRGDATAPSLRLDFPASLLRRLRFMPADRLPTGCIEFTGFIAKTGYGEVSIKNRAHLAHRLAYEMARGPVPPGLELDHLCENKVCVNPAHLEPVTHGENTRRWFANRRAEKCR